MAISCPWFLLLTISALSCSMGVAHADPSQLAQAIAGAAAGLPAIPELARHIQRRSLSTTELRRLMVEFDHLSERCQGNCTAANVALSATGELCEMEPPREVKLETNNHYASVQNSPILSEDEKTFFHHNRVHYQTDTFISPADDQFHSNEHSTFYYDPTRFPPIYVKWHCQPNSHTGPPAIDYFCTMPATGTVATPLTHGFCRPVCGVRLVLRQLKKTGSCGLTANSAGPGADSRYMWAWCLERVPQRVMCQPAGVDFPTTSCDTVGELSCFPYN